VFLQCLACCTMQHNLANEVLLLELYFDDDHALR
jgi:hypothetical protein